MLPSPLPKYTTPPTTAGDDKYESNGSGIVSTTLHILVFISPIILAACLGAIFWYLWVRYVQLKTFLSLDYSLLGIVFHH